MRAHLVQLDIAWEDPAANFAAVDRLIGAHRVAPGELIVLPELFDSGFSLDTQRTADRDGRTLGYLRELAQRLGAFVQGGRTVLGDDPQRMARNLATIVEPSGAIACEYAKVHPFSFGRESERFVGGQGVATYDWEAGGQTMRVCPAICYDLRFPELFRLGVLAGAQVIALGANWPDARQDHWRSLLIARAIENQAFVLGVNRTGADPHLNYVGGSIAVGPRGEVLGELGADEEVLSVDLELHEVQAWRESFPALRDIRLIGPLDTGTHPTTQPGSGDPG